MKRTTIASFIFLSLCYNGCSNEPNELIFDAPELVSKTTEEVPAVLGEPDSTFYRTIFGKRYFIQYYDKHGLEVRNYQGKIAEVLVNNPYPVEFKPESISRFGIDYLPPNKVDTNASINWKMIPGFKAVTFYLVGTSKPDSIAHNFKVYFNLKDPSDSL